ncbi:BnaA05g10640D [Brassica napus]|uniref:BnaA05g10640D protein n=1 Tax=Brassica napus TaxID=3708 RepID=A0A078FVK5_BRANA|nr:BnaA05g10640D [Brassica napus]
MTDRARRICDELRVCREEAIFYLEGFDWDLDAAMEACRSKTLDLPSLTVEPPPEKEKSSPKVQSPLPSTTTGSQSRNELIVQFINFAVGSDVQDATSYLERNDWDLDRAVLQFCDERRPTPSQRKLNRKLGRLVELIRQFLDFRVLVFLCLSLCSEEEQVPKAIPPMVSSHMKVQESTSLVQDREDKLSPVKESAEGTLSSVSSSQLTNTPEEQLSQWKEEGIKSFFKVAIKASREAAIACLSHCKWNQEDAISYFFGDYTEAIQDSTSPVKESAVAVPSSMSSSQLMSWPEEQLSRLKEKIIKSFRDVVMVASREDAEAYLDYGEWNQEDAISYFYGDYAEANPEIARSQADGKAVDEDSRIKSLEEASGAKSHVKIQESSSPTQTREDSRKSSREQRSQWKDELIHSFLELADGVTREVATVYLTLSNWNVEEAFSFLLEESSQVLASHGSPNKNYSEEDETGSSSSSSKADSTDTGNATVASSQADENVKDKDVEEELSPAPITTTTTSTVELEIILDNGESGVQVWILFRSDQTVRDIRNRIAWFRPEDKRDYYLKSDTGVEYRDLDTAVHSITSGSRGSTILHQMYST